MRKFILLLAAMPTVALAQIGAAIDAPWEGVTTSLVGTMSGIMPIAFTLAVACVALRAVFGSEQRFSLAPVAFVVPMIAILAISQFVGLPTDHGLGFFSALLDAAVRYGPAIVGALAIAAVLAYIIHRRHARSNMRVQLQADLLELLKTIELADLVEAYWKPRLEQITARTRIEKAAKARDQLLPMLEQVHASTPLTGAQRATMLEQGAEVAKVAVDAAGAALQPDMPQAPAASPTRPAGAPHHAQQARTCSTDSLMAGNSIDSSPTFEP